MSQTVAPGPCKISADWITPWIVNYRAKTDEGGDIYRVIGIVKLEYKFTRGCEAGKLIGASVE